jgi:hypothetical protein
MKISNGHFLFAAVLLVGCGTTRNVAVSSYHVTRDVAVGSYRVATAPVHYALGRRGEPKMVGTTDATPSDVTEPGQPVSSPQRRTKPQRESSQSSARTTPQVARRETTQSNPKPSSAKTSYPQSEFPTAKAVPDKPGYVFSPFDSSGRYVDVSGYASGTKVKDPWTDKIFVVP